MVFHNFKKWFFSWETSAVSQDFIRGVSIVHDFLVSTPEQVFTEMERIRLQHRLTRINKRLFDAYRRLGEQGIIEIEKEVIARAVTGEATERIYQQIEMILQDQKEVLIEMEQAMEGETSAGEIKHVE